MQAVFHGTDVIPIFGGAVNTDGCSRGKQSLHAPTICALLVYVTAVQFWHAEVKSLS